MGDGYSRGLLPWMAQGSDADELAALRAENERLRLDLAAGTGNAMNNAEALVVQNEWLRSEIETLQRRACQDGKYINALRLDLETAQAALRLLAKGKTIFLHDWDISWEVCKPYQLCRATLRATGGKL